MKYPLTLRRAVLALSLGMGVLPTWADDDCDAPLNRWQSRDAVRQMAAAQGWQIQRLKIDDGCYEIRGTDADGQTFKAKIDPESLKVLKMKQDRQSGSREDERHRDGETAKRKALSPQADGKVAPSPSNGHTSLGQIE